MSPAGTTTSGTAAGATAPAGPATRVAPVEGWHLWDLHVASSAPAVHDRVLTDVVGPVVAEVGSRTWFFVRYWQGGPHIRLRVEGNCPVEHRRLEDRLRALLSVAGRLRADEPRVDPGTYLAQARRFAAGEYGPGTVVMPLRPAGVHPGRYDREVERYGGLHLMPATERLFLTSSQVVLAAQPWVPDRRRRAGLALRATLTAGFALGGSDEAAEFFAQGHLAWNEMLGERYTVPTAELTRLSGPPPGATPGSPPDEPAPGSPLRTWAVQLRELAEAVRATTATHPGRVVFSHVHMFHNRLGLSLSDEIQTYALLRRRHPTAGGDAEARPP